MATPHARRSKKKSASIEVPARAVRDGDPANGARHELLAAKVLDAAAVLFATQGFAATSLKDVADAVGLRRSSIYYYYPDKDALLKELVQGVTLPVSKLFLDIEKEGLPPLARIREVVRRLVIWVADPRTHFRLMDRSEADLPDSIASMHKKAKRHVLGEMIKLIEAAVLAGEARSVDLRVCALSILGMTMWTAWWFQPDRGQSVEQIANEIADNAVSMVKRTRPVKQVTAVADLTNEIRENLALIERMTEKSGR
jgi:AcrR family transcriptional regulator